MKREERGQPRRGTAALKPRPSRKPVRRIVKPKKAPAGEAMFRSVFEHAAIGMTLMDMQGRIVRCNPAFARMLGYGEGELCGRLFSEITHPEDIEAKRTLYRDLATGRIERFQSSTRFLHKSGKTVWGQLAVSMAPRRGTGPEFAIGMVEDITLQEEAKHSLQAAHQRLKVLSARILDAQESERRMIALELHDEVGQALSAIKLNLHDLRKNSKDDSERGYLQSAMSITEMAFGHIRKLSVRLRPPQLDLMGLEVTLRSHLEQRTAEAGLALEFDCRLGAAPRGPRLDITCFRLVQEAVTNIIRHAQATTICVGIAEEAGTIRLRIKDDGIGFDVAEAKVRSLQASSMGLAGMEERVHLLNGSFEIVSIPGAGTEIRATLLPSVLERERRRRAR